MFIFPFKQVEHLLNQVETLVDCKYIIKVATPILTEFCPVSILVFFAYFHDFLKIRAFLILTVNSLFQIQNIFVIERNELFDFMLDKDGIFFLESFALFRESL